jgi:hypothetical protein
MARLSYTHGMITEADILPMVSCIINRIFGAVEDSVGFQGEYGRRKRHI